jgi:hypothetical protein
MFTLTTGLALKTGLAVWVTAIFGFSDFAAQKKWTKSRAAVPPAKQIKAAVFPLTIKAIPATISVIAPDTTSLRDTRSSAKADVCPR